MLNWIRKALRAKDGLAAIEFALLAPVLAAFFLGSIELADALDCEQKVTGMAATAADLVAQETQVTNNDITNVFSAINSIVYPYPVTGLRITVTSLVDNGSGGGRVVWSDAQNTAPHAVGATLPVPTGVIVGGGSVILTEVSYPYTSLVNDYLTGTTTMAEAFYARPRRSATISRVP